MSTQLALPLSALAALRKRDSHKNIARKRKTSGRNKRSARQTVVVEDEVDMKLGWEQAPASPLLPEDDDDVHELFLVSMPKDGLFRDMSHGFALQHNEDDDTYQAVGMYCRLHDQAALREMTPAERMTAVQRGYKCAPASEQQQLATYFSTLAERVQSASEHWVQQQQQAEDGDSVQPAPRESLGISFLID